MMLTLRSLRKKYRHTFHKYKFSHVHFCEYMGADGTILKREGKTMTQITTSNPTENNHIILSIALLVSNRKDTIQKCLDSLTPIREAIPSELILVDTGCDEDLRRLLEEYGDIVTDFTWCNDFSKARNESLRHAHGEWFMYLDDDEWFVDSRELIEFFVSGEYKQYGQASYIQRNFLDMEATQYTDSWVSRMIRLCPETHFESKIHEYMVPTTGDAKGLRSIVHHFGYVYETEEALWKHYERNVVLLKEMIEEEPDNLRWRIQLLQEYRSVKESRKLYEYGEECLQLTKGRDERYDNVAIGGFYGAKILALKEEKRYEEMLAVCLETREDRRMTYLCNAFVALRAADACFQLGRYAECEKWAVEYIRWKNFFDENEPLLYLQKPVPFVGECLDVVMVKEGYSLLICAGLKQGNAAYLEQYLDELQWNEHHIYVQEEIVPVLVEAMCSLPRQKAFETTIARMHGHEGLWAYFCEELTKYEDAGHGVGPVMDIIKDVAPDALMTEEEFAEVEGENAPSVESRELKELADGIKAQLRTLMDHGMKEQAAQVLAQVRRMLPEDAELLAMEHELES